LSDPPPVRLTPTSAAKERRLAALLAAAGAEVSTLAGVVEQALVLGSLELSGEEASWEDVGRARRDESAPAAVAALLRARSRVPAESPWNLSALRAWHEAALGAPSRWRHAHTERPGGPPTAPPEFIEDRLRALEEWLAAESPRELSPAQAGALVLARVVEIRPFADGNGRVSRLSAAHLMGRAGGRPPLLLAGDRARLEGALQAAFRLDTEPLVRLLEEASERCLDVMIQALQGR
jgi:hypothetical protein